MNRRSGSVALAIGMSVVALLGSGVLAQAKEEPSGAAPGQAPVIATPAAQAPVQAQAAGKSAEEKQREAVRTALDGTSWSVELRSETSGKNRQDTVSFKGRTISSEWLTKSGYNSSNYSLRMDGDLAIWETMQSKEGEGLAFWRGELQGDKMYGALNKQPSSGTPENFSFTAIKLASGPAVAAAPAAVAPAQPVKPSTPAAPASAKPEAPKKKKRGWF